MVTSSQASQNSKEDRVREKYSEGRSIWQKRRRPAEGRVAPSGQTEDFRSLRVNSYFAAQGSVWNVFPWLPSPANAHSLPQKSFSPFHKRSEWTERMVRLLREGGQRQVEAVSSHETFISMLQASQRNVLMDYHAGALAQLTLTKNTSALYQVCFWANPCFHHNIYFWVNRLNSPILIQNRKIREWK